MANRWRYTVNLKSVFHNNDMTFEEKRDAIVRTLRKSSWLASKDEAVDNLAMLVDELADTADPDDFDAVWNAIYDEADGDRVWIATV